MKLRPTRGSPTLNAGGWLMAARDVHLSSTLIGGRRHLRIVVGSPATTRATLEATIDRIAACSQAIGA